MLNVWVQMEHINFIGRNCELQPVFFLFYGHMVVAITRRDSKKTETRAFSVSNTLTPYRLCGTYHLVVETLPVDISLATRYAIQIQNRRKKAIKSLKTESNSSRLIYLQKREAKIRKKTGHFRIESDNSLKYNSHSACEM